MTTITYSALLIITAKARKHGATDAQLFFLLAVACAVPAMIAPDVARDIYEMRSAVWPLGDVTSWLIAFAGFLLITKLLLALAGEAQLPQLAKRAGGYGMAVPQVATAMP